MNLQSPDGRRPAAAFSLVELSVSLGIFGIVVMGIMAITMFTARSFEVLGKYSEMDQQSRFALDVVTRDIRRATGLLACDTNQIVLLVDGVAVTNSWDPTAKVLTRAFSGFNRNLLTGCDYLSYDFYKRTPGNNFTYYPTTDPTQAKMVNITWRCSRQIYGRPLTTENLQSATIVIRN